MRFPVHFGLVICVLFSFAALARASIGLVVGEPFGSFGTMMPQGHASVYLDHLCPETPLHLRPCRDGELGAVVSRQHDLHHPDIDWIAMPASVFFYGTENPASAPQFMTKPLATLIRDNYRHQHLMQVVPDHVDRHGKIHPPPYGDWYESIGAAFDRRLFVYRIDTTPEQDTAILALLNDSPNRRRYTLRRANCADFAADVLSVVLPHTFRRQLLADFDMTTPKSLARTLGRVGAARPELHLQVFEIPQIPGTLRRSRPIRGAAESLVKIKRYLVTVAILQPELMLADWIIYEKKGKWTPGLDALRVSPDQWFTPDSASTTNEADAIEADHTQ
jgi:hypothetical protein